MSPALDMPLSRREAVASVLAMLALVLGAGEGDATGVSEESAETVGSIEPLDPASTKVWEAITCMFSADDALPMREAGLRVWLECEDGRLMLTFREMGTERDDPYLARFQLICDSPAGFMNLLSERADAIWERDQEHFLADPRVHCRICKCKHPASLTCATCRGTGWIRLDRPEAEHVVRMRKEHRGALIEAAYTAAATEAKSLGSVARS